MPLAVPVAHLSDNETIHEIQCEVCPEVRSMGRPIKPVHTARPGPHVEQSVPLPRHAAARQSLTRVEIRATRATGGRLRPSRHRFPQPRPREDFLADAPVLRPPAGRAALRELQEHPHDGRSLRCGRLERHVLAWLVQCVWTPRARPPSVGCEPPPGPLRPAGGFPIARIASDLPQLLIQFLPHTHTHTPVAPRAPRAQGSPGPCVVSATRARRRIRPPIVRTPPLEPRS